jgi:hypothetical protein
VEVSPAAALCCLDFCELCAALERSSDGRASARLTPACPARAAEWLQPVVSAGGPQARRHDAHTEGGSQQLCHLTHPDGPAVGRQQSGGAAWAASGRGGCSGAPWRPLAENGRGGVPPTLPQAPQGAASSKGSSSSGRCSSSWACAGRNAGLLPAHGAGSGGAASCLPASWRIASQHSGAPASRRLRCPCCLAAAWRIFLQPGCYGPLPAGLSHGSAQGSSRRFCRQGSFCSCHAAGSRAVLCWSGCRRAS